ncbi:MAG: hypothetical protein OXR73_02415 [Myxococcales bacterium]|nr:hypothetical protein [Myxococcales bacterium]
MAARFTGRLKLAGARWFATRVLSATALLVGCDSVDDKGFVASFGHGESVSTGIAVNVPDGSVETPRKTHKECDEDTEGGQCELPNALGLCVDGECLLERCTGGFVDCDGDSGNVDASINIRTGCEATLTSNEHCGLCNAVCDLPHAESSCSTGQCRLRDCDPGYHDCDDDPENGCETQLGSVRHCGDCDDACDELDNAVADCIDGECGVGKCVTGYGDCDKDPENGCETELVTLDDCGQCGRGCNPDKATGGCETGECVIVACEGGYHDCNGLAEDGCEADLETVSHCGACGAECAPPNTERARCTGASEGARCLVDHTCPAEAEGCVDDSPYTGCSGGYADCDGDPENGCETALNTLDDCGECGRACRKRQSITSCASGSCETIGCELGFDQCGEDGSCISLANNEEHCGACGQRCPATRPRCFGGQCTSQVCAEGTADCNAAFECNTNLNDLSVQSCGLCDVTCDLPHANAFCRNGMCAIARCGDDDRADCDGVVRNGCETDLRTLDNCGACGVHCRLEGAEATCSDGRCRIKACQPGRADCNGEDEDGCETDTELPQACGSCVADCAAGDNVVRGGCDDGVCQLTCEKGFDDCDSDPINGCEASLQAERHCTACGVDCTALANVASAKCGARGCEDLVCEVGFADCDGNADNGCEADLATPRHCGACDSPCAPARGTGECTPDGACALVGCDPGFADCNEDPQDGCEASLASAGSCGACDAVCRVGLGCENGTCVCTHSDDCPQDQECCDGECVDTAAACSPWPCPIPGTARPLLHCGGCGTFCPTSARFFCCADLF